MKFKLGTQQGRIAAALALAAAALLLFGIPATAASPVAGTAIVNTATVAYTDANGNPVPGAAAQASTTVSGSPVLAVTVAGNPDPVGMGETLTYTISYANTGNAPASNVTASFTLSGFVTFQSATGGGVYSSGAGTVTWNLGSVAAYSGGTLTVTVTVKNQSDYPVGDPAAIAIGSVITTTANVVSDETSATVNETNTVGTAPNLELTLTGTPVSVNPGGVITYTLNYRNIGNLAATGVSLHDELPDQTAYVAGSATGGGTLSGRTLAWDIGTVAPGGSGTLTFDVTVSSLAVAESAITNYASLTSIELAPVISNQFRSYVRPASYRLTKTVTPVRAGQTADYTIRVYNDGYIPITNAVLTDPVPAGMTFVGADGGGTLNGSNVVWTIATLGIGEEREFEVRMKLTAALPAGSQVTNTVSVAADNVSQQSTSAAFEVAARTHSTVDFYNENWVVQHSFNVGDRICMQVSDADQNVDISAVDSVAAVLTHILSGDVEHITLSETGANTGVFRGCINSGASASSPDNNDVSVTIDSSVTLTYTDPQDGTDVSEATALIDPFGVVFNSMTGERIAGVVVTLIDASTGLPATIDKLPLDPNPANTTGTDGFFAFRFVAPGSYYFDISLPPGYTYPSILTDDQLPAGFVIGTGSRREVFTLSLGDEPLNLDIPVDPPTVETLIAVKTADRDVAYVGDIIRYTISVKNAGSIAVNDTTVTDRLPHGVVYVTGTSTMDGARVADPQGAPGSVLTWTVGGMHTGDTASVSFAAVVGADANRGDGRNTAYANGNDGGGRQITSNNAYHSARIKEGVFTTDGIVIGKVFHDRDRNGVQGRDEDGVPGAVVFMEDGTRVVADDSGRFVIAGVGNGTHVLKIDAAKLPCGLVPAEGSNRFMGSAGSQFADMTPGGLIVADFPVVEKTGYACENGESDETRVAVRPVPPEPPLEEKISGMDAVVAILSPAAGAAVSAANADIIVKGPSDGEFRLRVNGVPISTKNVGRRIDETEKKIAIIEYVGVRLEPGEKNTIEVEVIGGDGNSAGAASAEVTAAGEPYEIVSDPANVEIPADGETARQIKLTVVDDKGIPVGAAGLMTVAATAGEILNKDLDLAADGIQILYSGGAEIRLKSKRISGTGEITVLYEEINKRIPVFLSPSYKDEIALGLGEFTFGRGKQSGDASFIEDIRRFDRAYYSTARGAFFIKKRVMNNFLLTSSYDSGKSKTYELNNERYMDFTDENMYPVFGDDSTVGYEAKTQNKLYLRLEKEKTQLLIGDYNTRFFDTRLAAYSRTLNGAWLNLQKRSYRVGSFAAKTSQVKALDTIAAQGISGYYYLKSSPIVDGSESVTIETRDRQRPWLVLEMQRMTRWTDYTIDYETGAIMFRSPVPTYTESFDPVYILVRYETNNGGADYYMYGARGRFNLSHRLDLGFTAVTEENAASDYHQYGLDGAFRLGNFGTLKAELASTNSLVENTGGFGLNKGQAFSIDYEKKKRGVFEFSAYTRKAGSDFDNIHASDIQRGTDKYGFDLLINRPHNKTIKGKFFTDKDYLNDSFHRFSSLALNKAQRTYEWNVELFRETSRDNYIPVSVYSSRYPFDNTEETPAETTALRVGVSANTSPKVKFTLEHQQDIQYGNFNITTAGLNYKYTATTHSYLRQELWNYIDRSGRRTVFGIESAINRNTSVFNEYRMENGTDGSRFQRILGLKNKFRASKDLTLDFTFENLKTLEGPERNAAPDAFSLTTAAEYKPADRFKLTTRYEYRDATAENSHMFEVGAETRVNSSFTWILRQKYYDNSTSTGSTGRGSSILAGLAYRPVVSNRFNGFMKYEIKKTRSTPAQYGASPEARIFSIENSYKPDGGVTLTVKYAGKTAVDNEFRSYTDLWAARAIVDLTKRIDFSAEYRSLNSRKVGTRSSGGAVELGYRCVKNLWLSAGYAMDDFDADLTGDSYWGKGPYLKLRMKIE